MRIDVWIDINVNLLGYDFSRIFTVYIEFDFCSFILKIGFEKIDWIIVLLNYDWGKVFIEFVVRLSFDCVDFN